MPGIRMASGGTFMLEQYWVRGIVQECIGIVNHRIGGYEGSERN